MDTLQVKKWKDVKNDIQEKNPAFFNLVEKRPQADELNLVCATYPYGAMVIDQGTFNVTLNNELMNFHDNRFPDEIKKLLDYNWVGIPFGIVSQGSMESHISHQHRAIPFRLLKPGKTFSLMTVFEPEKNSYLLRNIYSNSAGCRTMILLPKVTHNYSHDRLSRILRFKEKIIPKTLDEHWHLFKEIASSNAFKTDWKCELIFFSKDFLNNRSENIGFLNELKSNIWKATSFLRNKYCFDFLWSAFEDTLDLSTKNHVFLIESVKQIIKVAIQEAPAMTPSCDNIPAPINDFSRVFLEDYKLRFHYPVFMNVEHFDGFNPVYYSLHKLTFQHVIPSKHVPRKTVHEIFVLSELLEQFRDFLLKNYSGYDLKDSYLAQLFEKVSFDFYHPLAENSEKVSNNIEKLVQEDPRFFNLPTQNEKLSFPYHSIFFHGCVRIKSAL